MNTIDHREANTIISSKDKIRNALNFDNTSYADQLSSLAEHVLEFQKDLDHEQEDFKIIKDRLEKERVKRENDYLNIKKERIQ